MQHGRARQNSREIGKGRDEGGKLKKNKKAIVCKKSQIAVEKCQSSLLIIAELRKNFFLRASLG